MITVSTKYGATHLASISNDNNRTDDEISLIREAKNGDKEAFRELVDKYTPFIERRADIANKKNRSIDPNEIISQTFRKFETLIERFDPQISKTLLASLARTISNIEKDLLRTLSREKRGLHGYRETMSSSFLQRPDPIKEARDEGLIAELIKPLEKNERIVIVLTIEGYSPEEIGSTIDRNSNAVSQIKARAIRKMSDALHRSRDSESVKVAA